MRRWHHLRFCAFAFTLPKRIEGNSIGAHAGKFGNGCAAMNPFEPTFLAGSRLRPILSMAGELGLRSLPPDVAQMIDRLKRERGL